MGRARPQGRFRPSELTDGRKSRADGVAASHHLLLSHGWAVEAIRREAREPRVGIILDAWRDGDMAALAPALDWVGVNNYSRMLIRANPAGGEPLVVRAPEGQLTEMGWEVYPQGLFDLLTRVHREYVPAVVYVTENGAAFGDVRSHDGRVHDPERIEYLSSYLGAVGRARAEGVPVKGYFVWSLLDNFEWSLGYGPRFGVVYVDYPSQERVPKDSFLWYRDLIAAGRDVDSRLQPAGETAR